LTHFPDPQQNPRRIDLFPFALLPVLAKQEGILIYSRKLEVVVALIYDGMLRDYRLLPGTSESSEDEILDFISSQVSQLENSIATEGLPLWVIGAGVSEKILVELHRSERTVAIPAEDVFGSELSCEMAPAALLALSELRTVKKGEQFNFRQGEFAVQGQLEIFRAKLVVAALMLLLVLAGTAVSMYLGYLQKTREASALKQQQTQIFKQLMPADTPLVDIPLQIESQLQELRQQVQLFGIGGHGAATVLQALSSGISSEIKVDVREFSYSSEEVRLNGVTDSFDAVNRITELLTANPLFQSVEISNAKLVADNDQVDFELRLKLYGGGGR
jgi:general secretion pathway protein L